MHGLNNVLVSISLRPVLLLQTLIVGLERLDLRLKLFELLLQLSCFHFRLEAFLLKFLVRLVQFLLQGLLVLVVRLNQRLQLLLIGLLQRVHKCLLLSQALVRSLVLAMQLGHHVVQIGFTALDLALQLLNQFLLLCLFLDQNRDLLLALRYHAVLFSVELGHFRLVAILRLLQRLGHVFE